MPKRKAPKRAGQARVMGKTPVLKRTTHSTKKRTRKNKPVGDPIPIDDGPLSENCACTITEIVEALGQYLFTLAGAETGDNVQLFINEAGELDAVVMPTDAKYWKSGPNGPGWYGT